MKKTLSIFLLSCLALFSANSAVSQDSVDMTKRAEELKNLRWGMFICWSFSTFSGQEWTPNVKDVSFFKATSVDTDQWAKTAKDAGMGYILFLTKHHDGFCLWDTKTTDRKVTNAPLGKDVLAELKKSCDKYGIKLALYFSEGDWTWQDAVDGKVWKGGNNPEQKKAQLKELLTQYGPIEYIWFDHAAGDGGLSHIETTAFCKSLQPGCFIGYNHGEQTSADIRLGEMGKPSPLHDSSGGGPYQVKDQKTKYLLAEFTYPILPPHQGGAMWFYSLQRHDNLVRPADSLYKDYLGAVKYGNIFSLDVGPNYEGKLRDIDVKTLQEVGQMIRNKVVLPEPISQGKKITASSVWEAAEGYEADKANDGEIYTRWGAKSGTSSGWLEIAFEKPVTVRYAIVFETTYHRTREFAIEYESNGEWKTAVTGTQIPSTKIEFASPLQSSKFRLNIKSATEVPTINEFQLY